MRQIMIEICDGHLRPSQVKQRCESIFSALYEGEWLTHQLAAEERVFGEPFLTENLIPMIVERMDQLPAGVLEKAAVKDSSALEKAAAKDSSAQEKAAKDSSAQEKAAKDSSARQKAAKDSSAQEFAAKDPSAQEFAAKDSSAQEFAAKDSSAQEFAEPADAAGNETGNEIAGETRPARAMRARRWLHRWSDDSTRLAAVHATLLLYEPVRLVAGTLALPFELTLASERP